MDDAQLLALARATLKKNTVKISPDIIFTKTHASAPEWQFSADSSLVSLGLAHDDLAHAMSEMRTMFASQWSNGMLPHCTYWKDDSSQVFAPNAEHWSSSVNPNAPKKVLTSGIASLPVQAFAVWKIYAKLREKNEKKAFAWLRECYPKLLHSHRYLHTARDRSRSGLITVYHPWESATHDSVRWDDALKNVSALNDSTESECVHGSGDEAYDAKCMTLLRSLRDCRYDDQVIGEHHAFRIKNVLFSSVLYRADSYLFHMAVTLGKNTKEVEEWMDRYETGIVNMCWNEHDKLFYDYDERTQRQICVKTIASLMPMLCVAISDEHRDALIEHFFSEGFCGDNASKYELKPTVHTQEPSFEPERNARGAVSLPLNWLLSIGLYEQGEMNSALTMRDEIIDIVSEGGCFRFYSSKSGKGVCCESCSSTAALTLDTLITRPVRLDFALNGILKATL